MNYFELFNLPVSFKVEKGNLAQLYFELQKKYHPDFFTQATEAEQAEALEKSAHVNKAFKVLKKEDETIKYVLQLKGLLEDEEKYKLPSDFLMEVMELNEDLHAGSEEQINKLQQEIYAGVESILHSYSENTSNADLLKVKEYYYKKKYLQRILDRTAD